MSKVRIGIDVGGTFTDAVIIDDASYELIAKLKIPTTHQEGVAVGIIKIIHQLLSDNDIHPDDVVFIAHGTTQATNALLEGDVASVGVIGMGTGMDARSAQKETRIESIELAPQKFLNPAHVFLDSNQVKDETIAQAISNLISKNSEVIVASETYSVDDPTNELKIIDRAKSQGLYATGGHEISQLYGLKMRTRTAVINASLIPKMMQTADMTEQAVIQTNIQSNLMIMRCDGGVMSINEVRKRPILTMLSGLAAGVAGALMYEKISDGIFFEVGGTSIDISVIKNGQVMIKYAQVGGHKTYLRSLDVRTLGVAGGSMIRIKDRQLLDVGPRSAHIAQLEYECFCAPEVFTNPTLKLVSPRDDDPLEYVAIASDEGTLYSLTLAGAANILGLVPDDDYAKGNAASAEAAWQPLADYLGISVKEAAQQVMDKAIAKLMPVIDDLIAEYELDRRFIVLVAGGGSAAVVVPALAQSMGVKAKIAENAPYISTIGVALAMVREQIERTVANPSDTDIKQIRLDVIERIIQSGANEETVDVNIEIDAQKNILRAIATGATELRNKDLSASAITDAQKHAIAAQALLCEHDQVKHLANSGRWALFQSETIQKIMFIKKKIYACCVIDREGVVRFKKEKVQYLHFRNDQITARFLPFVDDNTIYSDANATIPKIFLFYKEKMLDLTGMQTITQLQSIIGVELESLQAADEIIAIAYQ